MTITIQHAVEGDLDEIKALCDGNRVELGFVMRPSLESAIKAEEILVAHDFEASRETCVGFVHYHHRRDEQTTLYHIAVCKSAQGHGIGRALILALCSESRNRSKAFIQLKCPEPLSANQFYAKLGFAKVSIEPGKFRPLCIWRMQLG